MTARQIDDCRLQSLMHADINAELSGDCPGLICRQLVLFFLLVQR
jgi:hypothetical protein